MKLATLATSVLVLTATLTSNAAFAQTGNLVVMPGAKKCWIMGNQIFTCHYEPVRYYKRVPLPPTFNRVDFRRVGNNGGDSEKGGRRGGGSGGPNN